MPLIYALIFVFLLMIGWFGWYVILALFFGGGCFVFGVLVGLRVADGNPRHQQQEAPRQQQAPPRPRPRRPAIAPHWKVLGLKPGATLDQINERYHQLALRAHPDKPGGSVRAMQALNIARDLARREARP